MKRCRLRCLANVRRADVIASVRMLAGNLFHIVVAVQLYARRTMLAGADLLPGIFSRSVPIERRFHEHVAG